LKFLAKTISEKLGFKFLKRDGRVFAWRCKSRKANAGKWAKRGPWAKSDLQKSKQGNE